MKQTKWHGRVEGTAANCSVPGCGEAGEFRAPLTPGTFDGPGDYRWLCLDHVRQYNSAYNYFEGMTADEIHEAQSPIAGWERATRAFASGGTDPGPAWGDFKDPLDAISARYRPETRRRAVDRFTAKERHALQILGLKDDTELHAVRKRYSELVRCYHPDRNGGDRSHEKRLTQVIEAWQVLKVAPAFV